MLIHPYGYYLVRILGATFGSALGILALTLFVSAVAMWIATRRAKLEPGKFTAPTLLAIALIIYTVAFYSAEYEFDERPEQFDELFSGEERVDCGTSWTNWIDQTQGLSNPCPEGCYRGVTITKKYRMRGIFPPWPQSKRELQCWTR